MIDTTFLLRLLIEWVGIVAVILIARTSAKFRRPKLGFLYPRREATITLWIFFIAFAVGVGLKNFVPASAWLTKNGIALNLAVGLTLGLLVVLAMLIRKQPIRSMGLGNKLLIPSLELGFALALLALFLKGGFPAILSFFTSTSMTKLGISFLIILCEEIYFRGYAQPRLGSFWNERVGIIVTAMLFVLWNLLSFNLGASNWESILFNCLLIFIHSLICSWIYKISGNVASTTLYRLVSIMTILV